MKIVRIGREELNEWRSMTPKVVKDGVVLRDVTEEELRVLSELGRRVKQLRRAVEWTNDEKTTVIRVSPDLTQPGTFAMVQAIDGNPVSSGRDFVRQKFFERHGECQLRHANGKFLATIRDPARRSSSKDEKNAPKPADCKCKAWGAAHPGRHHQNCKWNELAPVADRAAKRANKIEGGKFAVVSPAEISKPAFEGTFTVDRTPPPARVTDPRNRTHQKPSKAIPAKEPLVSPEECDCQGWKKTTGSVDGEHHPVCGKKATWDKHKANEPKMMLVDLDTRAVRREATSEEISEARENGVATVGDQTFGVVPESEVAGAPV